MAWLVDLPDPREQRWVNVAEFGTRGGALEYASERFGADGEGLIQPITQADGDFVVDLPDPRNPEGAWIHAGTFPVRSAALEFLIDEVGHTDRAGRMRIVFESGELPLAPMREWSPRRPRR